MKIWTRLAAVAAAGVMACVPIGLGLAAAPAQAAGGCSLLIPSTVRITTPYQAVTGRLGSNCASAGAVEADWNAYHPTKGLTDLLWFFYPSESEVWDVYDWSIVPAVYTWRADGAFDAEYNGILQNSPKTDVRVGSWSGVTTSRSGSYVTIKTSSARYAYSLSDWVRWGGVRGTIQYYGRAGWTSLKYAYPNASGYYTYRTYAPTARSYRVVFPNASTIWGSVSGTSYR